MYKFLSILVMLAITACGTTDIHISSENTLLKSESESGWQMLFDGKSFDGWKPTTDATWEIKDNAIAHSKQGGMGPQSMIWTTEKFGDFILKCDFKITEGCNSGIFFRVGDTNSPVQTGFEMQINDSFSQPVGGIRATHSCGALYDIVAPSHNMAKPAGEWNTAVIICKENIISISLNGDQVVSTVNLDSYTEPNRNIDGSDNKFTLPLKEFPREGHIGFQQHGGAVWFKNIKIKTL